MNKEYLDPQIEAAIRTGSGTEFSIERLVADIGTRLSADKRLRRRVSADGRLRIDRTLPFLCVYRKPPDVSDIGTVELVTTEASYLFAAADKEDQSIIRNICAAVRDVALQHFNAFLLIEIWAEDLRGEQAQTSSILRPAFRVIAPSDEALQSTVRTLEESLSKIHFSEMYARVDVQTTSDSAPPKLATLLPSHSGEDTDRKCFSIGLAVHPVFRSSDGDTLFPIILQKLRRQLAVSIRKMLFTFTHDVLKDSPSHFHTFGPTELVKAVSLVDQQLSDVAMGFDYLLQITPVNVTEAWNEFESRGYRQEPKFYYRPLPRNPTDLKRALFDIPIDRIEDPTLSELFWEKQDELDLQITSLKDVDTDRFLYSSLQLYGEVEPEFLNLAESLLAQNGPDDDMNRSSEPMGAHWIGCDELIERIREEIAVYRAQDEDFHASVQRCNSIASGILVSKDTVLVDENVRVHPARLDGLMHHEIGTHLVTYFNGRRQPFQQMYAGLAGYESFQEGIAVLAEFLVDGLTHARARTLAARVVGSHMLVNGHSFVQTFERLCDQYDFAKFPAFNITTRIYRGGGSTKDAIYLRGFQQVLSYLTCCDGVDIDRLFVGKMALKHIPAINDLMRRRIIKPPRLMPQYLKTERAQELLDACVGKSVIDVLGLSNTSLYWGLK